MSENKPVKLSLPAFLEVCQKTKTRPVRRVPARLGYSIVICDDKQNVILEYTHQYADEAGRREYARFLDDMRRVLNERG